MSKGGIGVFECPECGSKKVTSTNRYSAGCGGIFFAFILFFVFSLMGASSAAVFFFWAALIVGVVSIGLGVVSGGTIIRCNECGHTWTQG